MTLMRENSYYYHLLITLWPTEKQLYNTQIKELWVVVYLELVPVMINFVLFCFCEL